MAQVVELPGVGLQVKEFAVWVAVIDAELMCPRAVHGAKVDAEIAIAVHAAMHAAGVETGEKAGAAGGADRALAIGMSKGHPLARQTVDMGVRMCGLPRPWIVSQRCWSAQIQRMLGRMA